MFMSHPAVPDSRVIPGGVLDYSFRGLGRLGAKSLPCCHPDAEPELREGEAEGSAAVSCDSFIGSTTSCVRAEL